MRARPLLALSCSRCHQCVVPHLGTLGTNRCSVLFLTCWLVVLQPVPEFVTKIIQIHDCKVARHGNMIVGKTGSGKSEAWKCLQRTLGKLRAAHPEVDSFQRVHVYSINPLALSNDELYGSFEEVGCAWQFDGWATVSLCHTQLLPPGSFKLPGQAASCNNNCPNAVADVASLCFAAGDT